jgi:cytochrome P450
LSSSLSLSLSSSSSSSLPAPNVQHLSALTYATLQSLSVLNATLWKTMRVYPVALGSLCRSVLRGGALVAGAGAVWLLAGTKVSVALYMLQRNTDVFP